MISLGRLQALSHQIDVSPTRRTARLSPFWDILASAVDHGVYQIGDVNARSWVTNGTLGSVILVLK
jgi:hypothetical protein